MPESTVRHDYDEFKSKFEKNIKAAREMEFPPTKKAQQNCMTSQPKNPMLAARQEADKKKLQKACDRYIMQEAKTEFEKYRKGGNPWHPNVSKTMFWM
ncbi:hypothetical protein SLS60_010988 [Paraconiothyrium brasiliense]|uniref:Uncharacterized protein n=1 Tax=Paraconiothyrium brasiliense TaxID=300254 RepID=A0ABR3QMK1_9PLEO